MAVKYTYDRANVNKPHKQRLDEAVEDVIELRKNQSQAAINFGVDRSTLNKAVKKRRQELAEQAERSALALSERIGDERKAELPAYEAVNEVRRIPPIKEFVRTYFNGLKCPKHGVHHEIPAYQDEIMEKVVDPNCKRLLVNVPPGHSKSTCGTVFTTIYDVCRDPNIQIALISGTSRMAERFLRQVKQYLSDPIHYKDSSRNLIEDWGPFVDARGNLGTTREFWVAGRQSSQKDPTVSAYGLGQQIQGARMDRIICDDIALFENQKNPDRIDDMVLMVTQDLMTRLDETGELVILGTRVLPGDLYGFLKDLPSFEVIRYPCILDEETSQVLWPEHYNFEAALRQRGSMSAEQWELVYQNSELAGIGASFTGEQLERCHEPGLVLGEVPPNVALVMGIDPAGAESQAGYTAMVLMGVDLTTGIHFLVDMVNVKQMKLPQVYDQVRDWVEKYPALRVVRTETNGIQSQLFRYDEINTFLGNKGIYLNSHRTHGGSGPGGKRDQQWGVEAMAPMFHNQIIKIPWGDLWSRRQFQKLEDQLVRFPAGKPDDLVMAAWMAWTGCKELYARQSVPMFDPRSRLPARLRRQRKIVDFQRGVRRPTPEEEDGRLVARQIPFMNVAGGVATF